MQNFGRQIQGADVALFYYAGHGVQVTGSNYLVPVSANPTREADVDFQMVDVNLVLRQMQGSGTRLNMVILDACRNNPFGARGLRSCRGRPCPDAGAGRHADLLCDPARQRRPGRRRRPQPLYQGAGNDDQAGGARHLSDLQSGRPRGEAGDRRAQQPWVSSSPIDGTFYFVAPAASVSRLRCLAPSPEPRLADTLRPDPDFVPIKDAALLRELSDRLYEHNFDPEQPDSKNGMKLAIANFRKKATWRPTGEATEGVLTRLRKMDDLKPWGSIVFGPDSNKWGISWNHTSRRAAVEDARSELRREQMRGGTELLWRQMRRLRDLGQFMVAHSARNHSDAPSRPRLTSAARRQILPSDWRGLCRRLGPLNIFVRNLEVPSDGKDRLVSRSGSACSRFCCWRRSGPALRVAQSGSAGGSIGNDEKSLSGSRQTPRAVESEKPARKSKPEAEEPRRAARKSGGGGGMAGVISTALGCCCHGHALRQQHGEICHLRRQCFGRIEFRSVSPNGSTQTSGSVSGLSWTSTGRFSGRTGSGSFVRSDGCTGRWTASKQ